MPETKIIVMYPMPTDVEAFDRAYNDEHVPLAKDSFKGMTKFVATKVLATPDGSPPKFYRIAELHFPSMDALKESAGSASAQEAIGHALKISSGGTPVFLIAEQESIPLSAGASS